MAIQGKKINELDLLQEDLTGNTVIPAVYVGSTTSSTANKVTINQISNKVQTDMSTIIAEKQDVSNLVTSLSDSSTDTQYPSAKCVYDLIGDIETLLSEV